MITTVGEAQIIVRANTAQVKEDLAATDVASDGSLATKAGDAGEDAGAALSSGFGQGAKDIGKDAEKDAEESTSRIKALYEDVGSKASNTLSNFGVPSALLKGNAVAALSIGAVAAVAVKFGSDMQKADASIATSAGITVKAATDIGNAFLDTGGKVEFSGIKQAQSFATVAGELKAVQGGALSTADANKFMASSMDLASASGDDLTDTSQTLAGVLQAFQMPIKDTASAANILFNATSQTGESLDTLATALETTKSKLGATSPPLSSLTALVVDMTHAGITGRSALTGVNTALTGLLGAATGTTKANLLANSTLKQYGVNALQANGQLTPLSTIIEKLAPKYATMTQAQQLATSTIIFGSGAAKQMTAVINAGTTAFVNSTNAVTKNNAVTNAAALQQDTLSGKFATLKSAVSDDVTELGQGLVPVLTEVVGAALPVIKALVDVVGWFEKGSTEAKIVAGVILATLAPALLKMASDAVTSAARSVVAFVTMDKAATTTATTVATEAGATGASIETIGAAATETAGVVEGETVAMSAAFTAMLGPIAAVGAAILGLKELGDHVTLGNEVNSSSGLQAKYDQAAKGAKSTKQLDDTNKAFEELAKVAGFTLQLKTSLDANTKALEGPENRQFAPSNFTDTKRAIDAYINPPNTAAQKAAAAAKKKAEEAAKKSATAAAEAAKKTGDAIVKAQTDLTTEVVAAIKEPLSKGVEQLKALGVPANKATQVLKDAVKPFTDAVTALEKAGFTAVEAVKIADAGQAELTKEAKTAAAAAKAAAKKAVDDTTSSLTALTVNGIAVSGSIYRAAIGAAYKIQTGANLNATGNVSPVTPPIVSAPIAPAPTQSLSRGVVFESGAIQIHPAPGNDAASLAATKSYIDQMLRQLTSELRGGVSMTSVIR
jgi:TP901 family phage tail tape measure protein